jgi:hypothetical protein
MTSPKAANNGGMAQLDCSVGGRARNRTLAPLISLSQNVGMKDDLKEQAQTTISYDEFADLCAAAWLRAKVKLQQLGVRRLPASEIVLSEIADGVCGHFGIQPNRQDRRHYMLKIQDVMADRMEPAFGYKLIVDRYTREAPQEFGSEARAPKARRQPRGRGPVARGKEGFLRKKV